MNIANLQLEGLYLAIAEIQRLLVDKGVVGADELDGALQRAERSATAEERGGSLSPAEQDAIAFSIRLLRAANTHDGGQPLSFSRLARVVGETKAREDS